MICRNMRKNSMFSKIWFYLVSGFISIFVCFAEMFSFPFLFIFFPSDITSDLFGFFYFLFFSV